MTVTDQKPEERYVYAAQESRDNPKWDQYWHVRPLPRDEFAFTSSSEPGTAADNTHQDDRIQMRAAGPGGVWGPSDGEPALTNGQLDSDKKWSIEPVEGADGFVRPVSRTDGWCLSDMSPGGWLGNQISEVHPCGSLPADQQRWRLVP
ncbi:hypothetical protein ABZ726_10485 [Streptomyces hundungensis]|uniref:hypothetical protein n=1 Tax=Streptomyces hundungensis TaxID=1077946 RepID=UPI0033CD0B24